MKYEVGDRVYCYGAKLKIQYRLKNGLYILSNGDAVIDKFIKPIITCR